MTIANYTPNVRVLAVILCCGCFSKPQFNAGGDGGTADAAVDDAVTDAPCSFGAWSALTPLPVFMNKVTGEPTITRDRLLMYWSLQTASGPPHWEIRYAERSSPTGTFVVHSNATVDPAGMNSDPDPAITDDGLTIIYRSGTEMTPTFHQATRAARSDTVWNNMALTSLAGERPGWLEISADGKTAYWATGNQELYSATRSTPTSDDFGSRSMIAQGIRWPSISGDQLTLYYLSGTNEIWQMTRDVPTAAFENPSKVFASGKDPDVTSDGTAIVIGANNGISIAERSCL